MSNTSVWTSSIQERLVLGTALSWNSTFDVQYICLDIFYSGAASARDCTVLEFLLQCPIRLSGHLLFRSG
ncbi:hypothetical protein M8J76_012840 [Diaphorina citri]|nr:hypothetical protein M8J76_012840 [Diaphorina citri]